MIFKYKELEIQLFPELDMKMIHDNKKSFINNKNIKIFNGVETLIHLDIIENDIIMIPETPEEELLITQDQISSISTNTNTHISNSNPKINSNLYVSTLNENFIWINKITGELFVCADSTIDRNIWIGQLGTIIKPANETTINDNLLFHYTMESYSGLTLLSTGTSCNAVMKNCKFIPGKIGNCLQFVGNSYITIQPYLPNLTGKIEMNLFIYPESFATRQNIISKCFSGELSVVQEINGTISFMFGNSGSEYSGQFNKFQTTQPLLLNTWTHITIKRLDYATAEIYYENTLIPVIPVTSSIVSVQSSNNSLIIGDGFAGNYIGRMDDFYFHTRNLSELERLYLISKGA